MDDLTAPELAKPLSGVDKLWLWLSDPETFDPIDIDAAEEIGKEIDALQAVEITLSRECADLQARAQKAEADLAAAQADKAAIRAEVLREVLSAMDDCGSYNAEDMIKLVLALIDAPATQEKP